MTIEARLEAITHCVELVAQGHAKTENVLRRAIAAGVKEARNQRKRSRDLDEKITQLASAQLVTEEKASAFDDKMTQLAGAQLATEEKTSVLDERLTRLADAQLVTERLFQAWLKRGGNGQH